MKAIRMSIVLFATLVLATWRGEAGAANLSGDCTTALDAGECPYTVTGTVTVPSGATCTVPAGCTVNGQGNSLVVDGTLGIDEATVSDVSFTVRGTLQAAGATLTNVRGMVFEAGSTGVVVSATLTEHASVSPPSRRFLTIRSSRVTLRNTGVTMGFVSCCNFYTGLWIENASPTVEGNTLTTTYFRTDPLIRVANGAPLLKDNTLTGTSSGRALQVVDASPTVTGNTFSGASTAINITGSAQVSSPAITTSNTLRGMTTAIALNGSTNATIDGNLFDANVTSISVGGSSSQAKISNNTFNRNTLSLAFGSGGAFASAFPAMFETNAFQGLLSKSVIRLPSSLASGTIVPMPVPYSSTGLSIPTNTTVVLSPGTVIKSESSASITVDGDLIAAGTPTFPVVFTSADPKNGTRWGFLELRNRPAGSQTVLENCLIEFTQTSSPAGLRLNNASIPITGCTFSDNGLFGIDLFGDSAPVISNSVIVANLSHGINSGSGANPVIRKSSIFSNGGSGINNTDSSKFILAENNYWGHDSGPKDTSDDRPGTANCPGLFNSAGSGEGVSNCVDYDPWIRIGPSIEGTITAISGGGQSGMVGTVLPQPLVVEVRSTLGSPLANIDVIFSVIEGDASIVAAQPVKTNSNGRASATVRLGLTPGNIAFAVTARDVNSPLATFEATGTGGGMLAFGLTATPLELTVKPGRRGQPGDVNNDGRVNNADAAIILGVLHGAVAANVPPAVNFSRSGDINQDGYVNEGDAFAIEGYVVGLVPSRRR